MQTFFENYLDLLQDCHNGILQALEGLPQSALDWVPGQDMNSIAVLLAHITGSERYWIGDIAAQESSNLEYVNKPMFYFTWKHLLFSNAIQI